MNTISDEVVGKNTVWSSEKVNKDLATKTDVNAFLDADLSRVVSANDLYIEGERHTDVVVGSTTSDLPSNSAAWIVESVSSNKTLSGNCYGYQRAHRIGNGETGVEYIRYRNSTDKSWSEWQMTTVNPSVGEYSILQEGSKTLNTSGWYRIAQAKSGTHNLSRTAQARVMNIKLESTYWNNEDSSADINMLTSWQKVDFYANVSGKYPIVSGIRYVYDTNTDIAYIDIYYRGTNNNTVFYHFSDSLFEKVDFEPADSLPSTATVFKTADITQNYVPYIVSSSETRPLSADNLGQPARRALSVDLTSSSMTESKPGFDGYIMTFTWDRNTSIADNYRTQLAIGDETGNGLKLRSYNPVNKKWTEWNAFYPLKVVEKTILLGNLTWNKSSQGKYYATYNNTEAGISNARIIISCQIYDFSNLKATDTIEVNPKNNTVTQICAPTNTFASDAAVYVRWIYS